MMYFSENQRKLAIPEALSRLRMYIESSDYAGYDPYDALNSPLLRLLSSRSKWMRMAFTQALRRSPVNLRPLLGMRRGRNPKALGLFLEGYVRLCAKEPDAALRDRVETVLSLLEGCRTVHGSGHGWGYNFDWQSKAFFIPKFTPTIVNSAFIGHSLLDAWEQLGIERARDLALPVRDFMLSDLNRIEDGGDFCFSYTPLDRYAVHNANLLGASLLFRISRVTADDALRDVALTALRYSMRYQRADGSWPYSEQGQARWIDSFHTGFNLEAIRWFLADPEVARQYGPAYEKGVRFYAERFFLPDGTPKYYHDSVYPIDIHSPAEAVSFFSDAGDAYQELTDRILDWLLREMYSGRGWFYFRKGRYGTNRIAYMRWSQAWAFRALAAYCSRMPDASAGTEQV